jgi:hypothetical protein
MKMLNKIPPYYKGKSQINIADYYGTSSHFARHRLQSAFLFRIITSNTPAADISLNWKMPCHSSRKTW